MVGGATENRSFEEAMAKLHDNPYVDVSRYYYQLEQFLPYFPMERILIVLSEELREDRGTALKKVFGFLDVDTEVKMVQEIRANKYSERRRWNWLGKQLRRNEESINKYTYLKSKYPSSMGLVESFISSPVKRPEISPALRERLTAYLQPDVEKLALLSGLDLSRWNIL